MKTEQKFPSRKAKALRRSVAFLVLLALYIAAGGYGLTPGHGIRMLEETVNAGPTDVVRSLGNLPLKGAGWSRVYLSANDNALLMGVVRFEVLLGWSGEGFTALDCGEEAPIHVGTYTVSKRLDSGGRNQVWYLYGRVDDPAGESVLASVGYRDEGDRWVELDRLEIPKADWLESGGRTYFVVSLPPGLEEERDNPVRVRATLADGQGRALADQLVDQRGWTSLG